MKTNRALVVATAVLFSASLAFAQGLAGELQELLTAVGISMALSKQNLAHYSWIQQTQVLKDGESKGTTVEQIQLGPDGQPIKITLSAPPPPQLKRGLRGHIQEEKIEETKEYVQQMMALAQSYLKPSPDVLRQQLQAGKAWLSPAGNQLQLRFSDVQKPGDSLTISIDKASRQIRVIAATSNLEQDPITVNSAFQSLPDGTDHMAQMTVASPSKNLQVQVVTLNYTPTGH